MRKTTIMCPYCKEDIHQVYSIKTAMFNLIEEESGKISLDWDGEDGALASFKCLECENFIKI